MSEQRKQMLENLAETLSKVGDEGLRAIEIFSAGVAAGSAACGEKKKEDAEAEEKKDVEK